MSIAVAPIIGKILRDQKIDPGRRDRAAEQLRHLSARFVLLDDEPGKHAMRCKPIVLARNPMK
jgi:hypothetical protein